MDVFTILDGIVEAGVLEDRMEYDADMLQKMYGLTNQEAEDLEWLIQERTLPHEQDIKAIKSDKFNEGVIEALHGNLDGWDNPHDRVVILRFLQDMVTYVENS